MRHIDLARLEARRARRAAAKFLSCKALLLPQSNRQGSKLFKAATMRRLNRLAAEFQRANGAALCHLAAAERGLPVIKRYAPERPCIARCEA